MIIDSDVVWFTDVRFVGNASEHRPAPESPPYLYGYSTQKREEYLQTMKLVLGLREAPGKYYG